jgi:hypothetical protein
MTGPRTLRDPVVIRRLGRAPYRPRPGASHGLGDRRGAIALLVQVNDLGVVERNGPALVNSLGLCSLDPCPLALADEPDLHLGDHSQHRQDHLAHRALRRDFWLEHSEMCALAGLPDTQSRYLPRTRPPAVKAECDSSTRVEVTGIGYLSTRCRFERSLVSGVCGSSPKVIR